MSDLMFSPATPVYDGDQHDQQIYESEGLEKTTPAPPGPLLVKRGEGQLFQDLALPGGVVVGGLGLPESGA
jgi:hypothetical protein